MRWDSMKPWGVEVPSLRGRGRAGATPGLSWGVKGRMKIPLSLLEQAEQSGVGKVKVGFAKTSIRSIGGAAARIQAVSLEGGGLCQMHAAQKLGNVDYHRRQTWAQFPQRRNWRRKGLV